jgi:G:T-mismatch repair DNA endonuclease (very short patch repair protein)
MKTHSSPKAHKKCIQKGGGIETVKLSKSKINYIHCHRCPSIFENKRALYRHYMSHHNQSGGNLQNIPFNLDQAPWVIDGKVDEEFKITYEMHEKLILANHKTTPVVSTYNFPVDNNIDITTMMGYIRYIYSQENKSFKLNFSFGYILKHIETQRYRFFKPYGNQSVLPKPFLIENRQDIGKLENVLEQMDFIQHILLQRESTKWKVVMVTNCVFRAFVLLGQTLGGCVILPEHIRCKKCIISLNRDKRDNLYNDNLCFFRCLVYHFHKTLYMHDRDNFESTVHIYYKQYIKYLQTIGEFIEQPFKGVSLGKISLLEACFEININIYELHDDSSCSVIYKSSESFDDLNLNKYMNHLSYIADFQLYALKFRCEHCDRMFKRKGDHKKHIMKCGNNDNLVFVGGFLKQNLTIFEELESFNIHVPTSERFFKEFIVFDMEAMMKPFKYEQSSKLTWVYEHIPVSVSVSSNHKDFIKPFCIVNEDLDILTTEMLKYITSIAGVIREDKTNSLQCYFEELDSLIYHWETLIVDNSTEMCISKKIMLNQLENLKLKFEKYVTEIPVLGFNSGRYDINLVKGKILEQMELHLAENKKSIFVIKKNNCYSCISNGQLKFLDITQYLSPGTSYRQFLRAFGISEKKGFFPYEAFQNISQLNDTELPPLGDAWYSSVRQCNILDDGEQSVAQNYRWLQQIWKQHDMKTFKDFLIWYNNLDVEPFVKALTRLTDIYFKRNVDIFKESVSVPGIARKLIFRAAKNAKASFSLIDKHNSDLYFLINRNIVGGPSIIFNRFQKKDTTFIRNNLNYPCKTIIGYDANSLYLWAIGQKMPTGSYIRRYCTNGFQPMKKTKYESMFYWMNWLNLTQSLNILHYQNNGSEYRVGPYLTDGFDVNSQTIYQYHGCWFHGHSCLKGKQKSSKDKALLENRQKLTQAATHYIKSHGYTVIEIYECEFNKMKKDNKQLQYFISQQQSIFTIKGVLSGDLFGMLEVDICVPNSWSEVNFKPDTDLEPKEYFHEMCPLFGNCDISFDDIGPTMQQHIIENNLSKRPRKLLIGAMKAEKMLLATPLLQWYIKHGMKITKIHQVIEFNSPSFCFEDSGILQNLC